MRAVWHKNPAPQTREAIVFIANWVVYFALNISRSLTSRINYNVTKPALVLTFCDLCLISFEA
jgi:hypothetical protein